MPLSEGAGELGDPLVGELLGELAHPLLGSVGDVVVAERAADERQRLELVERLGELVGELARLGDRPRPEHDDQQAAEPEDGEGDDGDGETPPQAPASDDGVDDRVEGEGDDDADPDRREHRRGVAGDRQQGERGEHGEHDATRTCASRAGCAVGAPASSSASRRSADVSSSCTP